MHENLCRGSEQWWKRGPMPPLILVSMKTSAFFNKRSQGLRHVLDGILGPSRLACHT